MRALPVRRVVASGRRELAVGLVASTWSTTRSSIMQAGFDIEEIERFGFSAQRFEPLIPHILGTARRV